MLEAVVMAHPTIDGRVPTAPPYWKLFRKSHPDFMKERSIYALGNQWKKIVDEQKKGERLTRSEQKVLNILEELDEEEDLEEVEEAAGKYYLFLVPF